jgi:hypothetical protein
MSLLRYVYEISPDVLKIADTILKLGQFDKSKGIAKMLKVFSNMLLCTLDKCN